MDSSTHGRASHDDSSRTWLWLACAILGCAALFAAKQLRAQTGEPQTAQPPSVLFHPGVLSSEPGIHWTCVRWPPASGVAARWLHEVACFFDDPPPGTDASVHKDSEIVAETVVPGESYLDLSLGRLPRRGDAWNSPVPTYLQEASDLQFAPDDGIRENAIEASSASSEGRQLERGQIEAIPTQLSTQGKDSIAATRDSGIWNELGPADEVVTRRSREKRPRNAPDTSVPRPDSAVVKSQQPISVSSSAGESAEPATFTIPNPPKPASLVAAEETRAPSMTATYARREPPVSLSTRSLPLSPSANRRVAEELLGDAPQSLAPLKFASSPLPAVGSVGTSSGKTAAPKRAAIEASSSIATASPLSNRDEERQAATPEPPPLSNTPPATVAIARPTPAKQHSTAPSPLALLAVSVEPALTPPTSNMAARQVSIPPMLRLPPGAVPAQSLEAQAVVATDVTISNKSRVTGSEQDSAIAHPASRPVAASTAGRPETGYPFEQIKEDGTLQLEISQPLLLRMKADVYRTSTADAAIANVAHITAREISITGHVAGRTHITFFLDDRDKPQLTYLVEVRQAPINRAGANLK